MKRDCLCGHMRAFHTDRSFGECSIPGCGCTAYRPKPGRRWLTRTKPPAPGDGVTPGPGRRAIRPPASARPPQVPGPPRRYIDLIPLAPHPSGGTTALTVERECTCIYLWQRGTGWSHMHHCSRPDGPSHDFDVNAWNARLRQ